MKKIDLNILVDWWLEKYHNTNTKKVLEEHPEWNDGKHSREFYLTYQVTQEQHDEWLKWAREYTKKITKVNKTFFEKGWVWVYLDTAPQIKQ